MDSVMVSGNKLARHWKTWFLRSFMFGLPQWLGIAAERQPESVPALGYTHGSSSSESSSLAEAGPLQLKVHPIRRLSKDDRIQGYATRPKVRLSLGDLLCLVSSQNFSRSTRSRMPPTRPRDASSEALDARLRRML